jgi:hypothetical protein
MPDMVEPDPNLVVRGGTIRFIESAGHPADETWSISVELAPISAEDQYAKSWRLGEMGPEVIRTSIELEFIRMPASTVEGLVGVTFSFPTNPEPGYIDGSVYLAAKHNPVDVTLLRFESLRDEEIRTHIEGEIIFEHELWGVPNRRFIADVDLRVVGTR